MPLWKFRYVEEAPTPLSSATGEVALRTALTLSMMDEAARRGIRTSQRGVHKYRTIEEAEAERERYALARLREK